MLRLCDVLQSAANHRAGGWVELGNGVAAYAEKRIAKAASIGIESRHAKSADDARTAGVTAKYCVESTLFQIHYRL